MKKRTKLALIFWIIFGSIGTICLIVGLIFHFPRWLLWLTGGLPLIATGLWITLHFLLGSRGKKKTPDSFTGNKAVYHRVTREINEAIARYLRAVKRVGFLKSSALYERPWFLVCGSEKSGKTDLLAGSGLNIPLKYPSESDGMVLEGGSGISWNFGNNAVWADMPGAMMTDAGADEWNATVHAIYKVRPERAIDGAVMVVSAATILNSEPRALKDLASSLRRRIDELISIWGIEFPVYLVINKSDEIQGFNELFRDPAGKWPEQLLGASLSGEQQKGLAKQAFSQEFELLKTSLRDMRFRMLAKEKDERRRRLICRFVIHFEGIQEKLGNFIAELFKTSSYEGKPIFSGFYFTSCQSVDSDSIEEESIAPVGLSQTIINHPLNPNRSKNAQTPSLGNISRKKITPYFTHNLFREIIPGGASPVKKTQRFTRQEMFKYYGISSIMAFVAFIIGWLFFTTAKNSIHLNKEIKTQLSYVQGEVSSRTEAYKMLGRLGKTVQKLKLYHEKGAPISMRLGMYKGNKIYQPLREEYINKCKKFIIGPSVRYLEYKIRKFSESYGVLSGDAYNELYRYLKSYLSISEAISGKLGLIDTVSLRSVMLESITNVLLNSEKKSRLSTNVETILMENIGLYLSLLKKGKFPLIQENQHLVKSARKRLCRLPSAQVLYETVLNHNRAEAQEITLNDLLERSGEGILNSSNVISTIYTQDGWDQLVQPGIQEACKDPYKTDWVVGMSEEDMPDLDLDAHQLYDDMKTAYFDDVKTNWLAFVALVKVSSFGDLKRCARMLQMLGQDRSELIQFFKKVSEYTQITESAEQKSGPGASGAIADIASKRANKILNKKVKKLTKTKTNINTKSFFKEKKGADDLKNAFEPFRSFVNSNSALGGLQGYCDKILTISEKITSAIEGETGDIVSTFNGKENDPLYGAWKYTDNMITNLPSDMALSFKNLLMSPLIYTGRSISNSVKEELNTLWKNDIVTIFANRFAGRYPFTSHADNTVFEDVMDFFRPATGIFWGFYDRNLSSYITKQQKKWKVKEIGSVKIYFKPELFKTLDKAEVIRDIFFQPDGTQRIQKFSISSVKTNKNKAEFSIGTQTQILDLSGEGGGRQFQWPAEGGVSAVSLKMYANNNVVKNFSFDSQWGLMRLFDKARVSIRSQRAFTAKWQANVQNVYMVYFTAYVKIAGTDNPFTNNIFEGFDCPMIIAVDKKSD